MTELPSNEVLNKVAAAFRFVGDDKDFQQHAKDAEYRMVFIIEEPAASGVVTILNSRVYWSTDIPEAADITVRWRSWKHLVRWTESWVPLWWYRMLRRVRVTGTVDLVLQECLYLFRNNLQLMLKYE